MQAEVKSKAEKISAFFSSAFSGRPVQIAAHMLLHLACRHVARARAEDRRWFARFKTNYKRLFY